MQMDQLVQRAGGIYSSRYGLNFVVKTLICPDFELQVTTLECLFRLTAVAERVTLAKQWFNGLPSLAEAFKSIRETFFEVVWCLH